MHHQRSTPLSHSVVDPNGSKVRGLVLVDPNGSKVRGLVRSRASVPGGRRAVDSSDCVSHTALERRRVTVLVRLENLPWRARGGSWSNL
jgi:hypothetical protein